MQKRDFPHHSQLTIISTIRHAELRKFSEIN